jgi:hypothetical protein
MGIFKKQRSNVAKSILKKKNTILKIEDNCVISDLTNNIIKLSGQVAEFNTNRIRNVDDNIIVSLRDCIRYNFGILESQINIFLKGECFIAKTFIFQSIYVPVETKTYTICTNINNNIIELSKTIGRESFKKLSMISNEFVESYAECIKINFKILKSEINALCFNIANIYNNDHRNGNIVSKLTYIDEIEFAEQQFDNMIDNLYFMEF